MVIDTLADEILNRNLVGWKVYESFYFCYTVQFGRTSILNCCLCCYSTRKIL